MADILKFSIVVVVILTAQFFFLPSSLSTYVRKPGGTPFPVLSKKFKIVQRKRVYILLGGLIASLGMPWITDRNLVWLIVLGLSLAAQFLSDILELLSMVDELDGR